MKVKLLIYTVNYSVYCESVIQLYIHSAVA